MSKSYDGCRRNRIEVDDGESNEFEIQEGVDIIHPSEIFRGFQKVPTVLCERIDITPYLNKIENLTPDSIISPVEMIPSENSSPNMDKLLHTCSVVLVRDNLEKLKEMVENNVPINGVSCLKCDICYKTYSSEKKLQNHKQNKHIVYKSPKMPKRVSFSDHIVVHEVTEYHRCRKCPKIFEDYNSLRSHMKQQHKKRKCYVCFYCSKDFVDRMFFKVHIKLHCDSCGLLLANKKKYLEHRRFVCKILKKYECKTCNMSFFNYMDLKDHSYDHLGTFFICDICKDQFETKCSVSHHIKFLHTKRRPKELYYKRSLGTDSVYVCNFCDNSSIDVDVLKEHVSELPDLQNRVLTGYSDYYFCDQCLKKFSTETDMLQHKWTHFLKTSDNSQLRNNESKSEILKTTYKVDEKLPESFQPKLVLERVKIPKVQEYRPQNILQASKILIDRSHFSSNGKLIKTIVDPITKKTIISKYQCEKCYKYLSSKRCLNRHLAQVHGERKEVNLIDLQCRVCEEVFSCPWTLQTHRCIRMTLPEMPFDDARPEIHFDNLHNGFDDIDISENDDYMNSVDFEIPAPIVQLTEFEHLNIVVNGGQLNVINDKTYPLDNLVYKVVVQEVPIEF